MAAVGGLRARVMPGKSCRHLAQRITKWAKRLCLWSPLDYTV